MLGITLKGTRVYEEAKEEGREEGREEGVANLIILQLKTRFGQELPEEMRARILSLPLSTLHNLGQALFNFTSLADLQAWLKAQ
jgi:predicted transposase YdaD